MRRTKPFVALVVAATIVGVSAGTAVAEPGPGGLGLGVGMRTAQAEVPERTSGGRGVARQRGAASGLTILAAGSSPKGGWVTFTGTGSITLDDAGMRTVLGGQRVPTTSGPKEAQASVGGGTWTYGSTRNLVGQKTCYSQYQHPTKSHGASVWMDNFADSGLKDPNVLASARITKYTNTTCSAYWRTS